MIIFVVWDRRNEAIVSAHKTMNGAQDRCRALEEKHIEAGNDYAMRYEFAEVILEDV